MQELIESIISSIETSNTLKKSKEQISRIESIAASADQQKFINEKLEMLRAEKQVAQTAYDKASGAASGMLTSTIETLMASIMIELKRNGEANVEKHLTILMRDVIQPLVKKIEVIFVSTYLLKAIKLESTDASKKASNDMVRMENAFKLQIQGLQKRLLEVTESVSLCQSNMLQQQEDLKEYMQRSEARMASLSNKFDISISDSKNGNLIIKKNTLKINKLELNANNLQSIIPYVEKSIQDMKETIKKQKVTLIYY